MRRSQGLTLLELLVASVITAILATGLSVVMFGVTKYETDSPRRQGEYETRLRFEHSVQRLLSGAYLDLADEDDTTTFFVGDSPDGGATQATRLTWTSVGDPVTAAYLEAEEETTEDLNRIHGPQGGIAELALSTTPFEDSTDQTGAFVRTQRPSDGDPEQGGFEELLEEQATDLRFEFFDGEAWQPTWDTTSAVRRLPSLVRMTYRWGEEETDRQLTVRLPLSDVTPDDPAVQEAGTQTGGGAQP